MKNMSIAVMAAAALVSAPTLAAAAPANPASSLSVAHGVRASGPAGKQRLAAGPGVIAAIAIAAGVAAIGIVAAVQDDDSDSN